MAGSDDRGAGDRLTGLVEHYERMRAQAVDGTGDGPRLGVGLVLGKGMAAWIKVAGACPVAAPNSASAAECPAVATATGATATELVRVLAAMVIGAVSAGV